MTFQKGHVVSEETRHKMSEAHKGANNVSKRLDVRKKISNALKGHLVTENARKKISNAHKGMKHSSETRIRMSKSHTGTSSGMKGKKHTVETLSKISVRLKGRVSHRKGKTCIYSEETRRRISESNKGRVTSDSTRKKLSESRKGYRHSEDTRKKLSEARRRQNISEQTKRKISDTHRLKKINCGVNNPMYGKSGVDSPTWRGGLSFEPYCPKFNELLKERIRERDNRTCQLCGTKENGKKLSVHHVHYDKENCEPLLISLCNRCNAKVNYNRDHWETLFIDKLNNQSIGMSSTTA